MENNNLENVYKNLEKQKRKNIIFIVSIILMLLIMAVIGIYFIVFDNVNNFLDSFQNTELKVEKVKDNKGFTYDIISKEAWLTEYTGTLVDITIPEEINNIPVTHIKSINNKNIVNITIPNSVFYIENDAFYHMKKLRRVYGGKNISTFGQRAFKGCTSLEHITFYDKLITIEEEAFCNTNLKSVTIPNAVNKLSKRAFNSCRNLTDITIGSGVYLIEEQCFKNCKKLEGVTCNFGTVSLDKEVFTNCSKDLTIYCSKNSDMVAYCKYEGLRYSTIPD